MDGIYPSPNNVLEFPSQLYDESIAYRTINGHRSALSALEIKIDGTPVGAHPTVVRMLKGIYNLSSPSARHAEVWEVNIVLRFVKKMNPVKSLNLKQLTFKYKCS